MHDVPSPGARLRPVATVRRGSGVRPALALLMVLCACGDGRSAPPADATAPKHSGAPPAPPVAPAISPVRPASQLPGVSPSDVVASRTYVGRQVRITGRCLTPESAPPLGPSMRARDVWQLEWEGVAVYVVGRAPSTCTSPRASIDTVTITAGVAEDTLPAIGDLPPAPRRYLVVAGEPPA